MTILGQPSRTKCQHSLPATHLLDVSVPQEVARKERLEQATYLSLLPSTGAWLHSTQGTMAENSKSCCFCVLPPSN